MAQAFSPRGEMAGTEMPGSPSLGQRPRNMENPRGMEGCKPAPWRPRNRSPWVSRPACNTTRDTCGTDLWRGLSALMTRSYLEMCGAPRSWGAAPGWCGVAPSALACGGPATPHTGRVLSRSIGSPDQRGERIQAFLDWLRALSRVCSASQPQQTPASSPTALRSRGRPVPWRAAPRRWFGT